MGMMVIWKFILLQRSDILANCNEVTLTKNHHPGAAENLQGYENIQIEDACCGQRANTSTTNPKTKHQSSALVASKTKSCIDQMEIARAWTYGLSVTDLAVMVEDEIVHTETSEIMIKCNWLRCHSSHYQGLATKG